MSLAARILIFAQPKDFQAPHTQICGPIFLSLYSDSSVGDLNHTLLHIFSPGSSAGAGSGEFHVYRHDRERETARLKFLDEQEEKVIIDGMNARSFVCCLC